MSHKNYSNIKIRTMTSRLDYGFSKHDSDISKILKLSKTRMKDFPEN